MSTRVSVTCPEHGDFSPIPYNFIYNKSGCPICAKEALKHIIFGVGVNDLPNESKTYAYVVWRSMIARCYSEKELQKNPAYEGCTVCEEWTLFSNFKKWFIDTYKDGCQLDKDIIKKGNKTYCPEFCCWVPRRVNVLLTNRRRFRGNEPVGVSMLYPGKYVAMYNLNGKLTRIGLYKTSGEAYLAYKQAKEAHIKDVAQEYYDRGEITKRVYDALMRYKVEITD